MVFDSFPFPCGKTRIFTLVTDAFHPPQFFTDKDAALAEMHKNKFALHVYEYVQSTRDHKRMRIVCGYRKNQHNFQVSDRIDLATDSDWDVIERVNPELYDILQFDMDADVEGVLTEKARCEELLKTHMSTLPDYLQNTIRKLLQARGIKWFVDVDNDH
jgi:hypothetical protein